ncbi:MAG: type I DNA topoisomerase [Acetobacteraceae bacterium]|nr:type I DNA topoisomerase [Acetobacteraceae bacterium]
MSDLVIVESPSKAKTIGKYLDGARVLASYGHVRDLVETDGAVKPERDFEMVWNPDARGAKQVAEIARALKRADRLILATDPDREGEAIAWHLKEMLDEQGALEGKQVQRITFNEITKRAVQEALKHPRDIDAALVEAYLARRALDYLVGYTLSPVLWRKLPGSRSAGRVQSVALRLIAEREAEIEAFRPREYWTVEARFTTPRGASFTARLTHLDGRRLEQFDLPDEAAAMAAKAAIEAATFSVASVERKRVRRNPPPPFMTSTLQMEASRKLGMGAAATMRSAQRLYEAGHITYMRTDGVQMSREAVGAIREHVKRAFGADYLPPAPREYTTRAKNAQEAHEAIRPTDVTATPERLARGLDAQDARLYELIWKRAVASQMASAELDQTTVEIADATGKIRLRASGSVLVFDGFLKLYREDEDDRAADARAGLGKAEDEETRILPPMAERDPLARGPVEAAQHFTQPPPRYTEASLIKRLEELGIGRPSTYATILQKIQDTGYVRLENRRFFAEDKGRLVTAFLVRFFERYVDTGFTSEMEEQLDTISDGRADWRAVMRAFWDEFSRAVEATKDLRISEVIEALDEALGPHFFPDRGDGTNPRACPACGTGRLGLRLGPRGAFIGCGNYPECRYTRPLAVAGSEAASTLAEGRRELGVDPASGQTVTLRRGPYGLYVQLGEAGEDERGRPVKPRRASLLPGMDPDSLTLERALALLSMPRVIGVHPGTGEEITVHLGRYGPYLTMGALSKTLPRDEDPLTIGINRAVVLLADAKPRLIVLGQHPEGGEVVVRSGRFGPYVQHGNRVANLPKTGGRAPEMTEVTLEQAVRLLAERGKELAAKAGRAAKPRRGAAAPSAAAGAAKPARAAATPKPAARTAKPAAAAKPAGGKAQAAATKAKPATAKATPKAAKASPAAPRTRPGAATARARRPAARRKAGD